VDAAIGAGDEAAVGGEDLDVVLAGQELVSVILPGAVMPNLMGLGLTLHRLLKHQHQSRSLPA